MTGRELHERFCAAKGYGYTSWEPLEAWDRLAAEVVPVSEVVAFLREPRRGGRQTPKDEAVVAILTQAAEAIEARFAPGTGPDTEATRS